MTLAFIDCMMSAIAIFAHYGQLSTFRVVDDSRTTLSFASYNAVSGPRDEKLKGSRISFLVSEDTYGT